MRALVLRVGFLTIAGSASAQTVLSREPHTLNLFAVVYVQGGNCSAGEVMKVTGIDRRLRKRTCVKLDSASVAQFQRFAPLAMGVLFANLVAGDVFRSALRGG